MFDIITDFLFNAHAYNLIMCVPTAIVGSAVVGAGATAIGSSNAANAQTAAAQAGNARLQGQYDQTRTDLQPYNVWGQQAGQYLSDHLTDFTAPIKMDQASLEATPGYQFNLTQGLKGVQNSAAARGLGSSGAALKGAASFTTGLADSTYQNQFNNANTNQTNAYNRLMGLINSGQNAAAQVASTNTPNVAQQSNNLIGAGNAQAAASNAIGSAVNNGVNNVGGFYAYQGLYGNNNNNNGNNGDWG